MTYRTSARPLTITWHDPEPHSPVITPLNRMYLPGMVDVTRQRDGTLNLVVEMPDTSLWLGSEPPVRVNGARIASDPPIFPWGYGNDWFPFLITVQRRVDRARAWWRWPVGERLRALRMVASSTENPISEELW